MSAKFLSTKSQSIMRWLISILFIVAMILPAYAEDDTFFETHIRPVLVEQCQRCHGADKQRGGLRLDSRTLLLEGGDVGPAIVPGDPTQSLLMEALHYKDVDLQMPPKGKLDDVTIEHFATWIANGAPWPNEKSIVKNTDSFDLAERKASHWAWKSVQMPTIPSVEGTVSDPIDAFILAQLSAKNLSPAPHATDAIWLRRVHFALTGLPPTQAEQDTFLQDQQTRSQVVDALLASPRFGERWGRHWLDLVRYAESRGHEFDYEIPQAYQYRDYVIRAFNDDLPYNQFVREQLAGDVVEHPRINPQTGVNESIIGTGFWHLGEEVHSPVDIRQDEADRFDNRIDVLSKTFLGLTVACARCHDHKFDAISTKDYYAFYALLEGSGYRQVRIDGQVQNQHVAELLAKTRPRIGTFGQTDSAMSMTTENCEAVAFPDQMIPDDVSFGLGPRIAGSVTALSMSDNALTAEPYNAAVFDSFWRKLSTPPNTMKEMGKLGQPQRYGFTIRTPSFTLTKKNVYSLVRGAGLGYAAVRNHTMVHGPLHYKLLVSVDDSASYRWVQHDLAEYPGERLHVEWSANPQSNFAIALVVQADEPPPLPAPFVGPAYAEEAWLKSARQTEAELKPDVVWESRLAPALFDGPAVDGHVYVRGNPHMLGDEVPHRSLEALAGTNSIEQSQGSGRRELAWQLTDPQRNPLITRVAVNRVWHHLFGQGIVASTDNFGVLGTTPTHPELLDYLATEFVREGWSLKRLIRTIVLSDTFAMSSTPQPDALATDPTNANLHTFRLHRLEGEAIRDAILQVSGQLDTTLGGPSVPLYLSPFMVGRGRPESGPLNGSGRRSIYLSTRRNFLNPFMLAFDTPIPFSTVGQRQISNVPAQSLILMNDPFVHEQAAAWAQRIMSQPLPTDERIRGMFRDAFARDASDSELSVCREAVTNNTLDEWTALAHTLFNVKEFIFIE